MAKSAAATSFSQQKESEEKNGDTRKDKRCQAEMSQLTDQYHKKEMQEIER